MANAFIDLLSSDEQEHINRFREVIIANDSKVDEKVGSIMSSQGSFVYNQSGVFKYGLAKTTKHFSFHSMVMYVHQDIWQYTKDLFTGIKMNRGCFNFQSLEVVSLDKFDALMKQSAEKDFSTVVAHYQNK